MNYEEVREKRIEAREKASQYVYYAIIFIASCIALVFLPLLSSTVGLGWNLPDTEVGWVIYIFTRVCVALINVLIFFSFMQQAKINVKEDEKYKAANEMLGKIKLKIYKPRSPKVFNRKTYGSKSVSIFISTCLATVALTQAILAYDVATMLTYLVTIVMGLVFGVINMLRAEEYWTTEYYDYAILTMNNIVEANGEEYLEECSILATKNSETLKSK